MKKFIKWFLNRHWHEVKVFEQKIRCDDNSVWFKQVAVGMVNKRTAKRKVVFVGDKNSINPFVLQGIYDWVNVEPKSNVVPLRLAQ